MPPSPPGLRAGRYELMTRLAAGGMGEVFIARATGAGDFEKRVALKLLLPHLSAESQFVRMFLDEARIAARMNHPNVIQIFDLGLADGRYFIAMALVEGVSLARLIDACRSQRQRLPLSVVRTVGAGLCAALAYAHELKGSGGEDLGIVHRDVNPSNVLLSAAGAVILTDFGIAKAKDNLHRTRPGDVRGKYAYMAPEQLVSGTSVDRRADLFALGTTLFEALCLSSPFARATEALTVDAIRQQAPPEFKGLRPDVSDGIARALKGALAKSPADRPSSARELKAMLEDGPFAHAEELGGWVERLCGPEVAALRGAAAEPFQPTMTRSLIQPVASLSARAARPQAPSPGSTAAVERPSWSRKGALARGFLLGAGIILCLIGARIAWVRSHLSPGGSTSRVAR